MLFLNNIQLKNIKENKIRLYSIGKKSLYSWNGIGIYK